jgi:hypothetical protein
MDKLPIEIVKHILSYNNCIIRKCEIIQINRIDKNDDRYSALLTIPHKKYSMNYGGRYYVFLYVNDRKAFYLTYFNEKIQMQMFEENGSMFWFVCH